MVQRKEIFMANNNNNSKEQNPKNGGNNKRSRNNKSGKRINNSNKSMRKDYTSDAEAKAYAARNTCNDPEWYVPTDRNLADVASFSYNTILGQSTGNSGVYTPTGNGFGNYVPGIASFRLIPTIGFATDETSPVNIAAINLYSDIRRANSGAKNYDAPDLMSVILAMGQVYSCMSWLFRIYGLTNVYSSQNRYIPRALVTAQGVNFDSILENQADFRARLNTLVLQVNSIYVPKGMPLFDRWWRIYEKIYADSSTATAQIYQAIPVGFYLRDDTTGDLTFTQLPWTDANNHQLDYQTLITYATNMVNSLLYSEDVGTISGDVLKAFGDSGIYRLPMIPEDYVVTPDLSDEIRSQFENAKVFNLNLSNSSLIITQNADKAYLEASYTLINNHGCPGMSGGKLLNFHKSDITPADSMVASRFVPGVKACVYSGNGWDITLSSVGSEIVASVIITTFQGDGLHHFFYGGSAVINTNNKAQLPGIDYNTFFELRYISAFDWFPEIRLYLADQPAESGVPSNGTNDIDIVSYWGSILDYDKYTYLSEKNIDDLNAIATLGLFGIPR